MVTNESVSVVLSVENAQDWLASDIERLIDCLADLSSSFEIIVIDNASHDFTIEVLEDMRSRFPQVSFRRLAKSIAMDDAHRMGMNMASGDFVFATAPGQRIFANDLRRLWALRSDPRLLVARSKTTARRIDAGLIGRLTQWAQRVTTTPEPMEVAESFGGLQMVRRAAVEQLQPMSNSNASGSTPQIEISHISHQQLATPKLVDVRRRVHSAG